MIEAQALDERTQVIRLRGAVDREDARFLQRAVLEGVGQGRTRAIVELGEVDTVDPGVLGALLRTRRSLLAVGGGLVICCPRPCTELFGVEAVEELVGRGETLDEAQALLGE
jgi:anti-anti-sigma factor